MLYPDDYSPEQWQAIIGRVFSEAEVIKKRGKQWTQLIDPAHVADSLLKRTVASVLVSGYLVCYGVGTPWYNPNVRALEEMLVLRVPESPGRFTDAIKALRALAVENQCDVIVAGSALPSDDRLVRVYERYGFRREATTLIQRI